MPSRRDTSSPPAAGRRSTGGEPDEQQAAIRGSEDEASGPPDGEGVRAVRRAVRCLRLLAQRSDPVTLSEIAETLGLPPSSTHRLLATLQGEGLIEQEPGSHRYLIGSAVIGLALRPLLNEDRVRILARPLLEELRTRTRETVHLAALRGADVVVIDQVESPQSLLVRHPQGVALPAHATALGKVLIADRPAIVAALVAGGLPRLTSHTITDPAQLEAELQFVRQNGYARNERQRQPDTAGVAAPVFLGSGPAIAAIGISGPYSRVRGGRVAVLGQEVRRVADRLTEELQSAGRRRAWPPKGRPLGVSGAAPAPATVARG